MVLEVSARCESAVCLILNVTYGLCSSQGHEWRRLRAPAQKHLSNTQTVEAYIDVQDPICDDLVSVIRQKRDAQGAIDDTCKELNKWALECKWALRVGAGVGARV